MSFSKALGHLSDWLRNHRLLAAIGALGLVLRAANLLWGLPLSPFVGFYHGDEVKAWESAVLFPENYLGSTNYLYGTAVQYLVGLLLLPLKLVLVYGLNCGEAYTLVAIVAFRLLNVLLGAATAVPIFYLGRRLFNDAAGQAAAALFGVAFTPTLNSPLTTLDVPMGFLAAAGLLQALRAIERPRPATFLLLGIIAGLLLGTKITGLLFLAVIVPWLIVKLFAFPDSAIHHNLGVADRLKLIVLLVATSLAVFAVSTPHIFLDWREYLKFMQGQKQQWYDKSSLSPLAIGGAWWSATATAVGAPTVLLALGGLIASRPWSHANRLPLVLFAAANYLFWLGYLTPRFVIPVGPVICLWAAASCQRLMASHNKAMRWLGVAGLAAALGWSLIVTGLGIATKARDPRTKAAHYIAGLPAGSTLGIATDHDEIWQHHAWRYPRIDFAKFRDTSFLEHPDYVITTSLELDVMRPALRSPKLSPDYTWDERYRADWYLSQPPSPKVFAFFDELFQGAAYEQIAAIPSLTNLPFDGGCPAVFVYRRKPDAAANEK